jgi:hypothetical protein
VDTSPASEEKCRSDCCHFLGFDGGLAIARVTQSLLVWISSRSPKSRLCSSVCTDHIRRRVELCLEDGGCGSEEDYTLGIAEHMEDS